MNCPDPGLPAGGGGRQLMPGRKASAFGYR